MPGSAGRSCLRDLGPSGKAIRSGRSKEVRRTKVDVRSKLEVTQSTSNLLRTSNFLLRTLYGHREPVLIRRGVLTMMTDARVRNLYEHVCIGFRIGANLNRLLAGR